MFSEFLFTQCRDVMLSHTVMSNEAQQNMKTKFSLELHMQKFLALARVVSPCVETTFKLGLASGWV